MDNMLFDDLKQRQTLTETYASFSQSRGGLGKVLGGIVGLVIILAATLLGGGVFTAVLTIGATALWLVGKELIRVWLYRPLGTAQAVWTPDKRREHLRLTGFVALIAVGITVMMLLNADLTSPETRVYLAFIVVMPFLTWRLLRTSLEFVVGVFLLAACAVHGAGGAYSLLPSTDLSLLMALSQSAPTWSSLFGALVLIRVGWQEHQHFQALMAQMQVER